MHKERAVLAGVSLPLYCTRQRLSQRLTTIQVEKDCDVVHLDKPDADKKVGGNELEAA